MNLSFDEKPKTKRTFNTNELAFKFCCTFTYISKLCRDLNIEPIEKTRGKKYVYDYNAYLQLKAYINGKNLKAANKIEETVIDDELEKEHPLVKDKSFLKFGYFPEIKPNCFEDLDDE